MVDNPCKAKLITLKASERYQRLVSKDSRISGIKAGHIVLRIAEEVGRHTTAEREEVIIILKGRGEAIIGRDQILEIRANHVLYLPPRTYHNIKNTGYEELEYIFVTSNVV